MAKAARVIVTRLVKKCRKTDEPFFHMLSNRLTLPKMRATAVETLPRNNAKQYQGLRTGPPRFSIVKSSGSRSKGITTRLSVDCKLFREAYGRIAVEEFSLRDRAEVLLSAILPSAVGISIYQGSFRHGIKLERWYEWRPVSEAEPAAEPAPEGPTDPELLKSKELASVMYLLSALERFEEMDDSRVREIAFEIALLGRSGLDYASSEQKYGLQSLPGEQFSGLQLMCLMYVGFKRVDPTVDTGMGLDEAYETALAMHRGAT